MIWDPYGTVRRALWIGGGQWAGKSTVANILAGRYGVTVYHADFPATRAHEDRRAVRLSRAGRAVDRDFEQMWVRRLPATMAEEVLAGFRDGFDWILDDLRGLASGRPILAEGWSLRPELVVPVVDSPRQMLLLAPTREFRAHQALTLPRAGAVHSPVSDPALAQRNRLARDELVGADAVRSAGELGVAVIEVDGRLPADRIADRVAAHFAPYLRVSTVDVPTAPAAPPPPVRPAR